MQTGWLAPNGDFYPCEVFDHVGVAEDIIDNFILFIIMLLAFVFAPYIIFHITKDGVQDRFK